MAVGNGQMWVVDNGEGIQPGDLLISSGVAGHAMKDEGKYEVTYVVARAAESVDWEEVAETVDDVKHKRISVLFENFQVVRSDRKVEEQQKTIETLKTENTEIRSRLSELESALQALAMNGYR